MYISEKSTKTNGKSSIKLLGLRQDIVENKKQQNFLAVDTSGNHLTVLASKNGNVSSVFLPNCAMKHAVSVMPAVEEALHKAELSLAECDFFSAVIGAGSFTGIRIGIAAVKGFCSALEKPSLPITSFETIAYNIVGQKGKILCLIDALHDAYYACGYEGEEVVFPPKYISEEEVLALAEEGYALYAYAPIPLMEKANVSLVDPCEGFKNAVVRRAEEERFGELTALYVRKSSAELNLGK